jgi:hypothetical protein
MNVAELIDILGQPAFRRIDPASQQIRVERVFQRDRCGRDSGAVAGGTTLAVNFSL